MSMSGPRKGRDYVLDGQNIDLIVRQQPEHALVTLDNKEKLRKAIDPPPIVEMKVSPNHDPSQNFLFSPYLFMSTNLVDAETNETLPGTHMIGQTSSSLHRLKDINNKDGGFFVFGDISIRKTGNLRLKFNLFNTQNDEVVYLKSILSSPFKVVTSKDFKGVAQSTHLSRTFSDQGVRLRLRKEARTMGASAGQKRGWSSDEPVSPESTMKRQRMDSQTGMSSYSGHGHINNYSQLGYGGHPTLGSNAPMHTLGSNAPLGSSVPRTNSSMGAPMQLGSNHILGSQIPQQHYRDGPLHSPSLYPDPSMPPHSQSYYNYQAPGTTSYSYTAAPGMPNHFAESQVTSYAGMPATTAPVDQAQWGGQQDQGMNWWNWQNVQL